MLSLRPFLAFVLAVSLVTVAGCQLMHELKPHRLSRWNYSGNPGGRTANFSISDVAADHQAAAYRSSLSRILAD